MGLEERRLWQNGRADNKKGDREEQDSNKVERIRDMNQNLGNRKKAAAEDTKEEKLCLRSCLLC